MRYIDELADLLSRVICQYLESGEHRVMDCDSDDEKIFSGTRKGYKQYLGENHLTEEEVFFIETVDELDFD